MAAPFNIFQTVQTYLPGELAYLQNFGVFIRTANKRFQNFQNNGFNLGSTVTFDLPPKSVFQNTLNGTFQASQQLVQSLTVDQEAAVFRGITAEQLIFNNMEEYMKAFGKADIINLASGAEANIALNAVSGMPLMTNGVQTGLHTESGPFRFYGNGKTSINSYEQLAQAVENFRELGTADKISIYLPNTRVPAIINSGLNQFVVKRNEETAQSWMLGEFNGVNYYTTNLLPAFTAGDCGNDGDVLTVVSTNDPTGNNITQITFSGATRLSGTDPNAAFSGDLGQFLWSVSGQPNIYATTYYGNGVITGQPVQFRVTANAGSTSGTVVLNVVCGDNGQGLCAVRGNPNQNISQNIVAGMQVQLMPSHRAGLLVCDDSLFLAMPKMPNPSPYDGGSMTDEKTGATMRSYYGMVPFQNQYGYVHDFVYGACAVPTRCQRILFPL